MGVLYLISISVVLGSFLNTGRYFQQVVLLSDFVFSNIYSIFNVILFTNYHFYIELWIQQLIEMIS